MSVLFLFGAGASCGSDTHGTPPIGTALFDALSTFNRDGWGMITGALAEVFRKDFEEGMKSVIPSVLAPLQRAMAAYFFEFAPLTSNLYFEMAARISARSGKWSGAVCTLNYERLLELSLRGAGLSIEIGSSPVDSRKIELCLPHGCCHLYCEGAKGISSQVVMQAFNIQTNGPIVIVDDPKAHRARVLRDAFPPVMSFFEAQKRTTAGAGFIDSQRVRWKSLVADAATLIVVGVRVRTADEHIWGPVASTSAKVVYCSGATAGAEFETWARAWRPARTDRILKGHFREEFQNICAEAGI